MDKVAAEKIASEYYNLGISLALEEANLIKTAKSKASGGKKLLAAMGLSGLVGGTGAAIRNALARTEGKALQEALPSGKALQEALPPGPAMSLPGEVLQTMDPVADPNIIATMNPYFQPPTLADKLNLVKDELYKKMLKERITANQSGERLVAEPLKDVFRAIVPNQAGDDVKRLLNTPEGEAMRKLLPTKLRGGGAPSELNVAWSATKDMADDVANTWARWGTALNNKIDNLTGINPHENVLSGLDQYSKMLDTAKQTGLEDATRTVTEIAPGRAELADLLMR